MLPSTFDGDAQLRISKAALGIFSVALLTAGFSLTGLMWFACRSWIFQADCVFLPSMTSCALGLLTVFYSFIVSSRYVWNIASLLTAIGAAVFTVIYAVLLILTRRGIAFVRKNPHPTDPISLLRRASVSGPDGISPPWHEPSYYSNHLVNMYPAAQLSSTQPVAPALEELTEEDLMHQQMLMLFHKQPESPMTPEPTVNSFNRIDFNLSPEDDHSLEPPAYGYYAPSAAPSSQQRLLQTRRLQPWDGVWRVDERRPSETARREERRREIEMRT